MTFDWWTLGLQTVNVLILVWILARFLFKPVARIIAERQEAAEAALDRAEAAREKADAARREAETAKVGIAEAKADILAEAQAAADKTRDRLLAEARAAAEKARTETRAELDRMRTDARDDLAREAGSLAAEIAARLVGRLPEQAKIDGFIDGLVDAVANLPDATRAAIGKDAPVSVRAARPLSADEEVRLTAGLAAALGHDVSLAVQPDPTLIAGLEIDAAHALVRNTFRADLDRIIAELAPHG